MKFEWFKQWLDTSVGPRATLLIMGAIGTLSLPVFGLLFSKGLDKLDAAPKAAAVLAVKMADSKIEQANINGTKLSVEAHRADIAELRKEIQEAHKDTLDQLNKSDNHITQLMEFIMSRGKVTSQ